MDKGLDLSSLASSDSGIGDMIGKLMQRPDLIQNIAAELGLSSSSASSPSEVTSEVPPESTKEENSVPASLGGLLGNIGNSNAVKKTEKASDKERLLLALKPYLSDKRRDAIDMMLKLDSLTSLMGSINPDILKTLLGGNGHV